MTNHRIQLMLLMAGTLVTLGATQAQGAPAPGAGAGPPRAASGPAPVPAPTTATADQPGSPGPGAIAKPAAKPDDEVPPGEVGASVEDTNESSNVVVPSAPAPLAHANNGPAPIFPSAGVLRKRRVKPLRTTMGLDPTAPDFSGEADLVSTSNEGTANLKPKRWTFTMHGYLRAPLNVGIGPSSVSQDLYQHQSYQLHSPANAIVGGNPGDWTSVGLRPTPSASLYVSAGNAVVSGTIILSAETFFDVGYKKLDSMGAISQGYVTLKFADAFGWRGGMALTAGAFSNRYGLAGPNQQSSGYYSAYLFGRTRVVGANLLADIDLDEHTELVIEAGGGTKLEVIPWLSSAPQMTGYLPDQGPTPQGTNLLGHAHAALFFDTAAMVAAHCMYSYSNNDLSFTTGNLTNVDPSHIWNCGLEGHLDSPRFGDAYLGYSHLDAKAVLSLGDALQAIQFVNGQGLTQSYLNPAFKRLGMVQGTWPVVAPGTQGDNGQVDTVLFQYILRAASLFELPATGRDLSLAIFGMYNHVSGDKLADGTASGTADKLKAGVELQYSWLRFLSAGLRFDRVMPDGGNSAAGYSAISPRLVFHSSWMSREYILLSYTRYFLGSDLENALITDVTSNKFHPDKNLLVLSAQIAF